MDINLPGSGAARFSVLKKEFEKGIEEAKVISKAFTQEVSSTGAYNIYSWMSNIPGFREWFEGQPRVKRNFESNEYVVKNRRWDDTLSIPVDRVEDDQLDQYKPAAKQMGAVGALLDDELVFDMLNNGFSTQTAYDDLSWFNAGHKAGLSTINNAAATSLSAANLQAAFTAMRNWKVQADKESAARPLNPNPKWLVIVPPALEWTIKGILKAQLIQSGTAFGTNIMLDTADYLVSSWLTSTTAWFVMNVGAGIKPVFVQSRSSLQMLEKTPQNDNEAFTYDEIIYGGKRRLNTLPTLPWLAWGSTG